ncbi:MAG TPA: 3-hydroxybutyryl-CoA dehydrogenase [Acidimicrobiia bacterium]|nr:3-hydroxybutyryl-CoA dehydrogenase [Acidimicrobiia bacterium]
MNPERVGVIGGGLMGSGIAEVFARAGSQVVVHEIDANAAEAAQARIEASLARAVERGKLEASSRDQALAGIMVSTDLADQADRRLVIEAANENEALKRQIFADLDAVVVDRDAILASNTSSIPITRLASVTSRPDHVVGLHFFNPVPIMALVEMVTTVMTAPEVAARARSYAEGLEKTVIESRDRAGFIVNMLLVPYLLGGIKMLEAGFATREDIDTGMRLGANHPMGPLELSDFVGLDTMKLIADVLFDEFKDPMYASPPLLTRLVEAGLLGRKTGRGFYEYG